MLEQLQDLQNGKFEIKYSAKKKRRVDFKVSIDDLINRGIISPGKDVLSIQYKSHNSIATLLPNGTIEFRKPDGNYVTYKSLSAFSLGCKRIHNPKIRTDDGWSSVYYKGKSFLSIRNEMFKSIEQCKNSINVKPQSILDDNLEIQHNKTNAFAIAKEERDELSKRRQRKHRNIGLKRKLHRENTKILQHKRREQVARRFRELQEEKIQQQQIQIMQLQNANLLQNTYRNYHDSLRYTGGGPNSSVMSRIRNHKQDHGMHHSNSRVLDYRHYPSVNQSRYLDGDYGHHLYREEELVMRPAIDRGSYSKAEIFTPRDQLANDRVIHIRNRGFGNRLRQNYSNSNCEHRNLTASDSQNCYITFNHSPAHL